MRTALLWLHVISGVVWIGTCAVIAIGANVLAVNTDEFRDFVFKAIPRINRLNLVAALTLLATGIVNFLQIAIPSAFTFSASFLTVLSLKAVLFGAMLVTLVAALRAEKPLALAIASEAAGWGAAKMIRLGILSAVTAVLGAISLILGLWLVGTP